MDYSPAPSAAYASQPVTLAAEHVPAIKRPILDGLSIFSSCSSWDACFCQLRFRICIALRKRYVFILLVVQPKCDGFDASIGQVPHGRTSPKFNNHLLKRTSCHATVSMLLVAGTQTVNRTTESIAAARTPLWSFLFPPACSNFRETVLCPMA